MLPGSGPPTPSTPQPPTTPPITKRLLFEQILPGVTLPALHHLKGQAQQMARKTVLSLAVNPQLTNKHVCSQDNTKTESLLSHLNGQLSICIRRLDSLKAKTDKLETENGNHGVFDQPVT